MVMALAQYRQTQSLNKTGVRSIPDVHELVLFCPGWQMLDCFESHLIAAWHRPEIMGE
jgi:hypothetical protein